MERIARLAVVPTWVLLIVCVAALTLPLRDWIAGAIRVFAPWTALAFLPAVVVGIVAAVRAPDRWPPRLLLAASIAGLLFVLLRFPISGGGHRDLPTDVTPLRVATWNLLVGNVPPGELVETILEQDLDIITLEELTPAAADAIGADPAVSARFPWRILHPVEGSAGLGILSTMPMTEIPDPDAIWSSTVADVALPTGGTVHVIGYHARPPRWAAGLPGVVLYDPAMRDADIDHLGDLVDGLAKTGDPVLVMGDLNLTPNEVAYDDLIARGLVDAHVVAGQGLGTTWRPARLMGTPVSIIRIDHILVSPEVAVGRVDVDCTPRGSDHCLVTSLVGIPVD